MMLLCDKQFDRDGRSIAEYSNRTHRNRQQIENMHVVDNRFDLVEIQLNANEIEKYERTVRDRKLNLELSIDKHSLLIGEQHDLTNYVF